MTQRTPTIWDANTAKNNGVTYSSSSVKYSSSTTSYSSATVGLDEYSKTAGVWTPVVKTPGIWVTNPLNIDTYIYDMTTGTYDTAWPNYDGIVTGINIMAAKQPTVWSAL